MYENNNTVSIDWKGLFLKVIIVAIIIFGIFKGYEYFSNKNTAITTPSTATQLFNANLESLRQAGENYYDYSNYPKEGQTVMVTLAELITKGYIKELYDANNNTCNRENSYVSVTNEKGQYKLKATLSCGETSNYTIVTIGCECEGDACGNVSKEEVESNKQTNSNNSSNNNTNNSNKNNNNNTNNKNNTNNTNSNKNNNSNNSNSSNNNNNENTTTTTNVKSTQVVDMSDEKITTTRPTTTTTTTRRIITVEKTEPQYKVTFDTNGGDYIEPQYVDKYDTAFEPDEPERDDARFVGWYYKGKLFDFDTEITKNITLEAYYWETDTTTTTVYSAAYDTYGTTYVTVTHKLAIPYKLREGVEDGTIKNVRIKTIKNERSMTPYSNDLYYHYKNHTTTYDGYKYNGQINSSTNGATLGRLYNVRANKTYSYTYDRFVTWSAYVGSQCPATFDGYNCNYGIVYNVVWEYDIFTD